MEILYLISVASLIIWLFVPFRQYKNAYFLFFLVLVMQDISGLILYFGFSISSNKISIFLSALKLLLLLNVSLKDFKTYLILVAALIINIISEEKVMTNYILTILYFLSLLVIIGKFFNKLYIKEEFSVYLFVFSVLLLTTTIKYFLIALDAKTGIISYYLFTFLQIFIGVFFVTNDGSKLNIKLRSIKSKMQGNN